MRDASPLVSVYLPTRNRAALLERALASVLAQTYANLEVIVADDASEDATPEVLAAYCSDDRRVKSYRFDAPRGAPAARNLAISKASGLLLTGIDDDDVWMPERVTRMMDRLVAGIGFVAASDIVEVDRSKRYLARRPAVIRLDDLLRRNVVGNQVLARRSDILACGGFDENLSASQDYDLWIRLAEVAGPGIGLEDPLQVIHAQPSRQRITTATARRSGLRRVYLKHRGKMSRQQRKAHIFNLFRTSGRPLSLRRLLSLLTHRDWYRMLAHYLRGKSSLIDPAIEAIAVRRDRAAIERALRSLNVKSPPFQPSVHE